MKKLTELKSSNFPKKEYIRLPEGISIEEIISFNLNNQLIIDRILFELPVTVPMISSMENSLMVIKTNDEEGISLIKQTQIESYQNRMSYLSFEEQTKSFEILKIAAKVGDNYKIESNHSLVGFITVRNFDHDGEPKILVSWIWSIDGLENDNKEKLRNSFNQVLSQYKLKKIIASVHLQNKRSVGYFTKLGFKPICLSLD